MKNKRKNNEDYVLATGFSVVDRQMETWQKQTEAKGNVYRAIHEYILCLKDSLANEDDVNKKYLIEKEIRKLEREQSKYYVPSVLEGSKLEVTKKDGEAKTALEKSSFALIKRMS